MSQQETPNIAHESADRVALEAARRMDTADPAKTYKEVYEEVYKFLVSTLNESH